MFDRRSVCLGTAATLVAATATATATARAALDSPLFVSGPMSRNMLAGMFKAPTPPLTLPGATLLSAHGPQKLSDLRGRTYLVSLWAEWCAPCLEEAPDLAAIGRKHGGPSFGVIFVLTGSHKKLDLAAAQALLAQRGAGDASLFVEPDGGEAIMNALASKVYDAQSRTILKKDSGVSLPCNLLVDRHGRVRARSFGAMQATVMKAEAAPVPVRPLTDADKARVLTQHTAWASPVGDEFAAALAAGLLEKA
jgi:thiol-disulfide isomerase/thioredoxin